jgi:DNA-binding MurR/RpiR family transcriptional regulator
MVPATAAEWPEVMARIREQLDTMSPQHRKVAICILEEPMILSVCGIEDFAARSTVSVVCVFRFAQQLGFSGFRAMRQACKQALTRQLRVEDRVRTYRSVAVSAQMA